MKTLLAAFAVLLFATSAQAATRPPEWLDASHAYVSAHCTAYTYRITRELLLDPKAPVALAEFVALDYVVWRNTTIAERVPSALTTLAVRNTYKQEPARRKGQVNYCKEAATEALDALTPEQFADVERDVRKTLPAILETVARYQED